MRQKVRITVRDSEISGKFQLRFKLPRKEEEKWGEDEPLVGMGSGRSGQSGQILQCRLCQFHAATAAQVGLDVTVSTTQNILFTVCFI